MSEETAQRLREANAKEDRLRAEAERLKQQVLNDVAAGIPARVQEIAKRTAHHQPEVTKKLGTDGIKILRSELADAAAKLATQVETAMDAIKWPEKQGQYSQVGPRGIHTALFNFMYGAPVNAVAAAFKRHGYDVHDDNAQRGQGLISPQSLYNEDEFAELASALNALGEAQQTVSTAKAEDDRDVVESLWQD
ncbi:hypothetical protein [Actinoplanes sp. NPDC051494]|uniref:hypothetical protein n=1 Tax=Actinoplanes sp. NPDC051494 TaxID=3363907 RepID=UPI00378EE09F